MQFHEALHQCQPKAEAALGAGQRLLGLDERLEDAAEERRVDATARVEDVDLGPSSTATTESVTRPAVGVNFAAFWSRFPMTCASRVSSPSTQTGDPARR